MIDTEKRRPKIDGAFATQLSQIVYDCHSEVVSLILSKLQPLQLSAEDNWVVAGRVINKLFGDHYRMGLRLMPEGPAQETKAPVNDPNLKP